MDAITICSNDSRHKRFRIISPAVFSHGRNPQDYSCLGRVSDIPQGQSMCYFPNCGGLGYTFHLERYSGDCALLGVVSLLDTNVQSLQIMGTFGLLYNKGDVVLLRAWNKHFIQDLCKHKINKKGSPVYVWWDMSVEEYVLSKSGKEVSPL